jgi:hypothetical protein
MDCFKVPERQRESKTMKTPVTVTYFGHDSNMGTPRYNLDCYHGAIPLCKSMKNHYTV